MAAVYANPSNQIAALKELYVDDQDVMKDLVYKKNPFLALVPKDESPDGMAGKYFPVPIVYATPQGRSNTFTNAQNQQTAPGDVAFFVYRASDYQLVTITNELLEATRNNAGAFIDQAKLNMDTGFRNISNNLAFSLYADGSATRGQISAITTSGSTNAVSITLVDPNTVVQFEVGMLLVASATSGGAPSTDTVVLTSVNRSSGIIAGTSSTTLSSSLSSKWTTANQGFLSISGDIPAAGASGTSSYLAVVGLGGWLPTTAPTSGDSFWNVNRSVDVTRLAGVRYNGQSETIEEALIDGASLVAREGGQPDMCFMSFASYAALEKALGAKVQYVSVKHDMADIAFAGITVNAPYGPITVIPDRNCPSQTAYLLSMDTWKFRSLGRAPHVLTYGLEGLEGIRVGNADALEIRIGYYGNLVCNAPGWNCVIQLSQ
jgi:hypothetical protein